MTFAVFLSGGLPCRLFQPMSFALFCFVLFYFYFILLLF